MGPAGLAELCLQALMSTNEAVRHKVLMYREIGLPVTTDVVLDAISSQDIERSACVPIQRLCCVGAGRTFVVVDELPSYALHDDGGGGGGARDDFPDDPFAAIRDAWPVDVGDASPPPRRRRVRVKGCRRGVPARVPAPAASRFTLACHYHPDWHMLLEVDHAARAVKVLSGRVPVVASSVAKVVDAPSYDYWHAPHISHDKLQIGIYAAGLGGYEATLEAMCDDVDMVVVTHRLATEFRLCLKVRRVGR